MTFSQNHDNTKSIEWLSLNKDTQDKILELTDSVKKRKTDDNLLHIAIHKALGIEVYSLKGFDFTQGLFKVKDSVMGDFKNAPFILEVSTYIDKFLTIESAAEQVLKSRVSPVTQRKI